MANRKASVWKYVRIGKTWRYCRPAMGANGKLRPHFVQVNGHVEHHPEGSYYIHYLQNGKQVWKRVGNNAADAVKEAAFQESYFRAVASGVPVQQRPEDKPPLMVSSTLHNYLEEYRLSKRPRSYALMKQTLEEFVAQCPKNIIDRITRLDLLQYRDWLIKKGLSERTAGNKMLRVNQYLRAVQGLKAGEGLVTEKDGKYTEREPEVYTPEELEKFFAVCSPLQFAVFKTFLMAGLRKQELENLSWNDVDFDAGTLKVSAKPGWSPKTWEERTIEVPTELLDILRTLPRKSPWVFANGNGNKFTHAWDSCSEVAKRAGIKGARPHKFRSTYATKLLQSGVDLKTVQKLLGHKNLESTMRYLAKARSAEVKKKLDAIWGHKR